MMKDEVRTQLSAYLDGEVGEAERRAVEAALAADAALRAELDGLRRTAELVRSLPRRAAPAGFAARVQAAIAPARQVSRPWLRGWRPAAIAAAACLLLGLAALLMPRPDGGREVAKDITSLRQQPEGAARDESVAGPAPATAHGREGAAAAGDKKADKLEAMGECLARTDDGATARGRKNGAGYTAAPTAPAPAEQPAFADAKDGKWGGRGGAAPKPGIAAEEKAMTYAEGERAPADDARKELKLAEAKEPRPTAAPSAVRSKVALTVETAKDKAAKRDSDVYSTASGAELRKAGKAGGEAQDPAAGEKRRALDRQELMDAIEREYRVGQSALRRAMAPAAGGGMANGRVTEGHAERRQSHDGLAGRMEMRLAYADLARCLAEWQAALDAANLAYAVRPVGGGEFVIEATLPAPSKSPRTPPRRWCTSSCASPAPRGRTPLPPPCPPSRPSRGSRKALRTQPAWVLR